MLPSLSFRTCTPRVPDSRRQRRSMPGRGDGGRVQSVGAPLGEEDGGLLEGEVRCPNMQSGCRKAHVWTCLRYSVL